ncbi:hypothetical protein BpHYR1_009133 [Brachionus plicatilis]|uniref:Uncharacterized protein n=1 Tax=Brachionus plicatilis TaxID=10195 RepID=A0A3M7SGA3_BRAPC|nr:hypothetical protein BpHYR1_009133 [Brachionus plicatilis]
MIAALLIVDLLSLIERLFGWPTAALFKFIVLKCFLRELVKLDLKLHDGYLCEYRESASLSNSLKFA